MTTQATARTSQASTQNAVMMFNGLNEAIKLARVAEEKANGLAETFLQEMGWTVSPADGPQTGRRYYHPSQEADGMKLDEAMDATVTAMRICGLLPNL